MANQNSGEGEDEAAAWGTWDELLLACAVKRHGFKAWESVASEVQSRTSLPLPLTTPLHCELKYQDLQRRFTADDEDSGDKVPWLDELRRRRVAELRQEVQRYDVSILSLQLKVKKLEDEREEEGLREDPQQPDPPEESQPGRSDHHDLAAAAETAGASAPEKAAAAAGGEESDRENRSVNGSNSTGLKSEHEKAGRREGDAKGEEEEDRDRDRARTGSASGSEKADQASEEESKREGADSYNGSSEPNRERRGDESDELRDSVGQSRENSSDVQSSASLTRRKKRKGGRVNEISCGGGGGGGQVLDTYDQDHDHDHKLAGGESQPLLDILKLVRAHKHSSLFDRRLAVQEGGDKYHNIIRQHIDMDTIQSRLRKGSYSSSSLAFYRDLLLLFDNALVFYPKSSPESATALDLHRLISSELRKKTAQTTTSTNSTQDHPPLRPKPELERSDSLLAKHKSSTPIIVCRKRSSFSAKPSPKGEPPSDDKRAASDSKQQQSQPQPQPQQSKEHQNLMKINSTAEKSVTGARSLRRSNTNLKISNAASPSTTTTKKTTPPGSSDKTETPGADQKKSEGPAASTKKRSAADFLKRIKRNSPAGKSKNVAVDSKNSKGGGGSIDQKKKQGGKGGDKGEERASRQSGGNSGVKQAKEDSSPSKRSVGRPPKKGADLNVVGGKRNRDTGGGKEVAATTLKQPRKRTRR